MAAALKLRSRGATEANLAAPVHKLLPRGPLRQLSWFNSTGLVDWDESGGILAKEALGLPGMPPVEAVHGTPASFSQGKTPTATSIHDLATPGRHCNKNEELFLGMCYKNCTLLTGGTYPIRFAPNGCCRNLPCLTPSEVDMQGFAPGTGYIVSANGDGSYPHPPGSCNGNEESFYGLCYKKCSLLTNNVYTIRSAANTCCKKTPCYNPFNAETKGEYCTGYGIGGGLSKDEKCPHNPKDLS